ncbi:hypothetical protein PSE_p0148 (plasmid) [Pseudovibrio sp. FO-BEG1]|nr:hypothetical protein PSE_p0148 [Pseudovibrio sp. FO-BEG1]
MFEDQFGPLFLLGGGVRLRHRDAPNDCAYFGFSSSIRLKY